MALRGGVYFLSTVSQKSLTSGAVVLCVVVCGGLGFVIGRSAGTSSAEAAAAQAEAREKASQVAFRRSLSASRAVARRNAVKTAGAIGKRRGTKAGREAGQAELANRQAAEAAQAPKTGYFGGCREPLFVDGYCPTPQEVQAERDIEAYCGPGMKLPDGRIVPKPGC